MCVIYVVYVFMCDIDNALSVYVCVCGVCVCMSVCVWCVWCVHVCETCVVYVVCMCMWHVCTHVYGGGRKLILDTYFIAFHLLF